MADPETLVEVIDPADKGADLWTADSERAAIQTSDDPASTPAVELDAEPEAAPVETTSEPERDANGQFKPKGRKKRDDPIARMQDATAKEALAKEDARIAREEAARYKAELDAVRQPAPADPQRSTSAEKFAFPPFANWLEAHPDQDWDAYQDAKLDARDDWRETQRQTTARVSSHSQRMTAARQADPTFDQLLVTGAPAFTQALASAGLVNPETKAVDLPAVMAEAIMASPKGPEIFRHLLTHPADAVQLAVKAAALPTTAAAVDLVRERLELFLPAPGAVARPDSASGVRPSAATPPINRVGGTATVQPADPDDLEFGPEYIRRENLRERQQREAGRW